MVCRLCHAEKPLRLSHVISEFLYAAAYDGKHRLHELSTDPNHRTNHHRQKGIREALLCEQCEQLLSKHEKYVKELLSDRAPMPEDHGHYLKFAGIDYRSLRLLQLSLLWRASISSHPWFTEVKLPESDEESIRKMLFTEDPGQWYQYPCAMFGILTLVPKADVVEGLVIAPETIRENNNRIIRFICGGYAWIFVPVSDAREHKLSKLFAREDGSLILPKAVAEETELFCGLATRLREQGKTGHA